jgi:H+-transporting ATPase
VSFIVLDLVKVFVIKKWSFELTAKLWPTTKRKQELVRRQERAVVVKRYQRNVAKLRKCVRVIYCISLFKKVNGSVEK